MINDPIAGGNKVLLPETSSTTLQNCVASLPGQLRDEDNTWLLLNELQEKWLAYRASTPGVQRVRPGILEYFGPQKDSD